MQALERISDAYTLTDKGAIFREDITFEEWLAAGREIYFTYSRGPIWLGDWINTGRDKFGDKKKYGTKYREAMLLSNFDAGTLRNAAWMASKVHLSRRRDNLDGWIYQEVASLPPKEQVKFLDQAEAENLSRVGLRRVIRAAVAEPIEDTCGDGAPGFSLSKALGEIERDFNVNPPEGWTLERRVMVKKRLQSLVDRIPD